MRMHCALSTLVRLAATCLLVGFLVGGFFAVAVMS
ncbi:hypothetical protein F4559_003385 [Saccharothrix violaceirubra]|uniref:Uncharacterized protein n=1 Tax=Saccharothrix violaceirubra TaxID=413306 RepID=A0A7W7T473_9PSEU|nr:hypothetical protein [Saccharothrix violaceirubra]